MANRVSLTPNGLRISKPGVNVLTASEANLNFSSDWSAFAVVASGTYTRDFASLTGSGNETLPFGRSLSGVPVVLYDWISGGRYYPVGGSNRLRAGRSAALREGTISRGTATWSVTASVTSTGLLVAWEWDRKYPQIVIPDFVFRWTVFSYSF